MCLLLQVGIVPAAFLATSVIQRQASICTSTRRGTKVNDYLLSTHLNTGSSINDDPRSSNASLGTIHMTKPWYHIYRRARQQIIPLGVMRAQSRP